MDQRTVDLSDQAERGLAYLTSQTNVGRKTPFSLDEYFAIQTEAYFARVEIPLSPDQVKVIEAAKIASQADLDAAKVALKVDQ